MVLISLNSTQLPILINEEMIGSNAIFCIIFEIVKVFLATFVSLRWEMPDYKISKIATKLRETIFTEKYYTCGAWGPLDVEDGSVIFILYPVFLQLLVKKKKKKNARKIICYKIFLEQMLYFIFSSVL